MSLFTEPEKALPGLYTRSKERQESSFPVAERFYANAVKLPVWAFRDEKRMVDMYIRGIVKVAKVVRDKPQILLSYRRERATMGKTKPMQTNVNNDAIEQLLRQADADGIQKKVVGAVIRKGEKFLLLERLPEEFMGGLVELPSGNVDEGEGLLEALAREVKEETGLTVSTVLAYISSFDYVSGSGKKARQFNFLMETEHGSITLSPTEHQTHYFVATKDDEFSKLNISDATKAVLEAAEKM